jgi:hypothetical protein
MTQEQAHSQEHARSKRKPSKGEALFDGLVYGGMNYVGTFLLTIPVAYSLKNGVFKKAYTGAHEWLVRKGMGKDIAGKVLDTTMLMQGGNVMLLPIMAAEKHKRGIVDSLNKSMGDTTDPKSIEEAPQQDWWSLIKSRALAWGAVFVSFTTAVSLAGEDKNGKSNFGKFEEWVGSHVTNVFRKPKYHDLPTSKAEQVPGVQTFKALEAKIEGLENYIKDTSKVTGKVVDDTRALIKGLKDKFPAYETRTYAYGKIAAIDAFATAASVALLYMGTRVFGKRTEDGHAESASLRSPTRIKAVQEIYVVDRDTEKTSFSERITQEKEHAQGQEQSHAL